MLEKLLQHLVDGDTEHQLLDSLDSTLNLAGCLNYAKRWSPDFDLGLWIKHFEGYDYRALALHIYHPTHMPTYLQSCPALGQPTPSWADLTGLSHEFRKYDILFKPNSTA